MKTKTDDQYSPQEAAHRRDAVVRAMVTHRRNTRPHQNLARRQRRNCLRSERQNSDGADSVSACVVGQISCHCVRDTSRQQCTLPNRIVGTEPPPIGRKPRDLLQDRFDASLIAVWTYGMRMFGRLSIGFQRISQHPIPQILQIISLLLSVPFFKASHLCFKITYALQLRRLRFVSGYGVSQGGTDLPLQFDSLGLKDGSVAEIYHRLNGVCSRLERAGYGGKGRN